MPKLCASTTFPFDTLIPAQITKKLPAIYGTQKLIALSTRARVYPEHVTPLYILTHCLFKWM